MKLVRSLTLALALGVTMTPIHAAHRVHHSATSVRPGAKAVHWLRHEHGKRLVTGATNHRLEEMSRDAASFLTGAVELMDHDLDTHWSWAAEPAGPIVTRVGNASVKNLATVRDGRGLTAYDWFSFDYAGQGHAMNDLRQLLVSLVLLGHELAHDDSDISGVVLEAARTYRDGIGRMAGNPAHSRDWAMTGERANAFTRRMLNIASHWRREDLLNRWTVVGQHGRRFKLEGEFVSIERHQAAAYWEALKAIKTDHRPDSYWMVKDAVVRSENGRHTGEHHEVYLLIEGPTASLVDDFILVAHQPPQPAHCVQQHAWKIRRAPEPFFGPIHVDGKEFLLREVQPEWLTNSDERIDSLDEYYDLARAAATLLARAHAITASDPKALGHFARDWTANPHEIEGKLAHFAFAYAGQVHADHEALAASWTPRHTLVKKKVVRRRVSKKAAAAAIGNPNEAEKLMPPSVPSPVASATPAVPPPPRAQRDPADIVPQPPPPTPIAQPATPATPATPPPVVPQPLQPPEER